MLSKGPLTVNTNTMYSEIFKVNTSIPTTEVEALFMFRRYATSHLIQTFVPSSMLVLVSLASLWVPSDLVPGRMALAVTTMLTLQSMINSVFTEAPR